jgi:hypothetical protein
MAKARKVLLVCAGGVAALLLGGCGKEEVPPVQPVPVEADFSRSGPAAVDKSADPVKRASSEKPAAGSAGNTVAEVNAVVNYAVGATPLQAKKRIEQRLETIQRDHDRQLQRALSE